MGTNALTHSSRTGDIAEFYAVTWLWDNGYEVFNNSGCTGPIDLIALDSLTNTCYYIDVKSTTSNSRSGYRRSEEQKRLGVRIVEFNAETRKCRFINHGEVYE